ncbi:MAG: uroporphyrinogen-III synthase [Acidilobus sp.]|nr:uroporphyrinogen-III synthase [Acidilobus sp.]MCG2889637.1 uroporphyrinogen-III synthase [Acidilobus sp.]MCG2890621.1 uroporphyrinogen-III synthase [Acidilobus sp.]
MEGGCRALYLGPELPLELRDLKALTWVKAVVIEPLDEGLRESARLIREGLYDCVAFTSPRAPLLLRGFLQGWPGGPRPLCVGPGTARAFTEAFGLQCYMPRTYTTGSLASLALELNCRSLLTLRSEQGDDELEAAVRASANVHRVNIYRERVLADLIPPTGFNVLIASSALIAEAACQRLKDAVDLVIAMGPKAARKAKELCPKATVIEPQEHSFKAVREALAVSGCS